MTDSRRRVPPGVGVAVAFAVVVAWLFWPVLTGDATFVHADALSVSLPLQKLLAEGLAEGRIPRWSADIYGGHPILAEGQGGFLHPVNWLLFGTLPRWLDAAGDPVGAGTLYAHGLLHLFCTWIAAWGCFGLARALGLRAPAALFAAGALAFSPDWLGQSGNSAIALSTAFVPLAAWAAERWWQAPSAASAARFGAVVALILLGGYPQAAHALAIGLLVVFGVRADAGFWRRPAPHLWTGALVIVAALGLAAMQLLPTLELVGHSVRAEGVELAAEGSLPRQLRGLLFSGGKLAEVEPGLGSLLVLFFAGLGLSRSRLRVAFALAALVLLQLALADASPLYRALHDLLPGLSSFRITHLYATVGSLWLCVLAGFGLQRVADAGVPPRSLWLQGAAVAAGLGGLAFAFAGTSTGTLGTGFAAAGAASTAALLWARRPAWIAPGLVALLLLEVAAERAPLHAFVPAEAASEPPATARFLRERHAAPYDFRLANVPHFFSYVGFAPPHAENLDRLARLYLSSMDAGSNLLWDLPSINANLALPLARRAAVDELIDRELLGEGARAPGLRFSDLHALRYVVAKERRAQVRYAADLRRVFLDPELRFAVIENPSAASRIALVPAAETRWVADLDAALASFDAPSRARAVLEGDAPPPGPAVTGHGAWIVEAEPGDERIRVVVEGAEAVHLVVSDAPYPGWTATVDGAAAQLVPANVLGKAVAVPAGRHEVVLSFRSAPFETGRAVSALTAVALAVLVVVARRRSRGAST